MISFLMFISCFGHSKIKYEYTRLGVVDQADGGVCVVELDDWHRDTHSPETIHIYSKKCKDGDIISFGRLINGRR